MESTTTWEVPREHWATYLSQVAALQKDRPVKVELVGPELGEQTLTRLARLRSLLAERKGAAAGSIELDLGLNGELDHRIIHPVRLYAIEAPTGQLECLDIEDESRTKTLIRFLQPLSLGAGTRGRPSRAREVLARDYMTSPPLVIRAGQSASQALELMQRHGIRHLPVVDPTEHLLGVVSDRDLYASKYG
ncbi:MAG: CBS domain-containing protein, partial [Myxococcota bacterium]